ncbi:unnamed protein product [Mucor hiemalis]
MSTSSNELSTIMSSPTRYHNRYSERYKSLLTESPPRDFQALRTPEKAAPRMRNSPLQSNREHRIFEEQVKVTKPQSPYQTETVSSTTTNVLERVVSAKTPSPSHQKRSTPVKEDSLEHPRQEKRPRQQEQQQQHQQQQQQQPEQPSSTEHRRGRPHYMQATSSYESRVHSNKERRSLPNLGPRSKGGITKRVGTTKVPRYHATTTINAIEDIQSEMQPDDVYIPMAARIKLFEKGLGNGSNRPVRQSSSTPTNSQPKPQPSRSTSTRISPTPMDTSLPSYARRTVASETKEKTKRPSSSQKIKSTAPTKSIVKSNEMDKSFNEKLNLWKGKDKLATIESYRNRGMKRKNEYAHPRHHKNKY